MDSSTPTNNTAQRFVVSEDENTVFDSRTGLTWQRNHLPRMTWSEAIDAADQANAANQFSHSDWRVPTRDELKSLIDLTLSTGPKIDQEAFPVCSNDWFWTSETFTSNPAGAWLVLFYGGDTGVYYKNDVNFVRLVRSGR